MNKYRLELGYDASQERGAQSYLQTEEIFLSILYPLSIRVLATVQIHVAVHDSKLKVQVCEIQGPNTWSEVDN